MTLPPPIAIPVDAKPPWARVDAYELQFLGAKILTERCFNFGAGDLQYLDPLVEAMEAVVTRFTGWGLSAPQVGAAVRVTIAKLTGDLTSPAIVLINPVITQRSINMRMAPEGCLSIPGYEGKILRHRTITVRYLDRELRPRTISLSKTAAQVIQHEVDHLEGRLLTDRVSKGTRGRIDTIVANAREKMAL